MSNLIQYQPITGPVWREPVAEKLAWLPSDRYAGRALARAPLLDWSVYPLQPPAVSYDPNVLDWLARDGYSGRALPRGRLDWGEPSQPTFVYDLVDWLPADRYAGRPLPRVAARDWTVQPPPALYRPELLEWLPSDRYAGRISQRARHDWSVEPRRVVTIPYDPSDLGWLASDRYYGRALPFSRQSPVVYDPTTPEPEESETSGLSKRRVRRRYRGYDARVGKNGW